MIDNSRVVLEMPCEEGAFQHTMSHTMLRDYFAAKAMTVAFTESWGDMEYVPFNGTVIENNVTLAYTIADAMMAARNRTMEKP